MNNLNFLDANVWLALIWSRHVHSEKAKAWFERASEEQFLFCRITQVTVHKRRSEVPGEHELGLSWRCLRRLSQVIPSIRKLDVALPTLEVAILIRRLEERDNLDSGD